MKRKEVYEAVAHGRAEVRGGVSREGRARMTHEYKLELTRRILPYLPGALADELMVHAERHAVDSDCKTSTARLGPGCALLQMWGLQFWSMPSGRKAWSDVERALPRYEWPDVDEWRLSRV